MDSIWETPDIQICWVVPKGLKVTLQMPYSAAFARVVFLSSEGAFVFDFFGTEALNIQTTRLQTSNTKIFILWRYLHKIVNRSVIQLYLIWCELILSSPRRRYLFLKMIRFFVNRLQVSTYYTFRTNKSKDINSSYNPVFCFREVSISKERWLQAKQVTDWRISTRSRRLEKAPMESSSRYVLVPNSNWEVF